MTYTMMIKVLNRVGTDITAKDAVRFLKGSILGDTLMVRTKDFMITHNIHTGMTHTMTYIN